VALPPVALMPAASFAEVGRVRTASRRGATLGYTALLTLLGLALMAPAWSAHPAGASPPLARSDSAHRNVICIVTTGTVASERGPSRAGGARHATEPAGHRSGNLGVAIPPAVFVRARGARLTVTTNTGEPPQPDDTYYVVSPHKAQLASSALRREVLATCLPPSRHH
jgi:hypothetical protein